MADGIGWEWVFWINLPVSAIAIALVVFLYPGLKRLEHTPTEPQSPASTKREKLKRVELVGGVLLAGSILMLLFGVHDARGSSAGRTAGLLVGSGILLLITGCHQHFLKDKATYPTRLFANRHFVAPLLYGFFMKGSEAVVYYLVRFPFRFPEFFMKWNTADARLPFTATCLVSNSKMLFRRQSRRPASPCTPRSDHCFYHHWSCRISSSPHSSIHADRSCHRFSRSVVDPLPRRRCWPF
jgi:predicted MFS family arabinose efflux permease